MARHADRERAIELRLTGMSYSQIKEAIGVSKSTLHYWLRDYPLGEERIRALRDWSAQRIERCRETKARKKEERLAVVYERIDQEIGILSDREIFIAGMFLYWGEGSKTANYTVAVTNTDPAMLRFFLRWLQVIGADLSKLHGRLHLYSDMDLEAQTILWSRMLGVPKEIFRNPYIKDNSSSKRKNYKGRFGYGTCSLVINKKEIADQVLSGIKVLRNRYL